MLPGEGPHVKRRVFRPIAVVDPDGTRPPGLATLADAFLALRLVQVRCACLDPVGVAGKGLDRAGTQARLAVAARADFSVGNDQGGQRGQVGGLQQRRNQRKPIGMSQAEFRMNLQHQRAGLQRLTTPPPVLERVIGGAIGWK